MRIPTIKFSIFLGVFDNEVFTALHGLCGDEIYWQGVKLHASCYKSTGYSEYAICIECMTQSCEEMYDYTPNIL